MCPRYRLNLDEIEWSLRNVQKNFAKINDTLDMRRETLDDTILNNLLSAYDYLDRLLKHKVNLLDRSELNHFLELNHIILCGEDAHMRKDYKGHIKAVTDRFYSQEDFCISHILAWQKKHKKSTPWVQAAGLYTMLISQPQLFLEGNHRTGAMLMSHILVSHKCAPFVLTVDNAKGYFDPSTLAKTTKKDVMGKLYKLPKIKRRFATFLENQANNDLMIKIKK